MNAIKKKYFMPQINKIILDNQVSLALESTPPIGPEELVYQSGKSINPFKISDNSMI